MDAERRLEVGDFVEVVLEALSEGVAVGSDEVSLHLSLADLAVSETNHRSDLTQTDVEQEPTRTLNCDNLGRTFDRLPSRSFESSVH